jgi:hypothetical protein
MLRICIVLLQQDYEIKDIKVQTFKLKHDGTSEIETFDVEKSDGTIIESDVQHYLVIQNNVESNRTHWFSDVFLF